MPERHGFLPEPSAQDLERIRRSKNPVFEFFDQLYDLKDTNGDPTISTAIPSCYA